MFSFGHDMRRLMWQTCGCQALRLVLIGIVAGGGGVSLTPFGQDNYQRNFQH